MILSITKPFHQLKKQLGLHRARAGGRGVSNAGAVWAFRVPTARLLLPPAATDPPAEAGLRPYSRAAAGPPAQRPAARLGSAPGGRRRRRASGVRPDDVAGRSGSGVTGRRWRRGAGRLRGGACCVRGDAEARDGGARAAALRGRRAAPPPVPAAACPRRRARAHGEAGPGLPRRRSGGSPGLPAPGPCCRRGAAAPAAARRARPGGERRAAA